MAINTQLDSHGPRVLASRVKCCVASCVGVPLLLGSLYGADFLQAALAASALPEQASLVLADQPQHVTMARFKALTDTPGALRRLMGGVFGTAHAEVRKLWAHSVTVLWLYNGGGRGSGAAEARTCGETQ